MKAWVNRKKVKFFFRARAHAREDMRVREAREKFFFRKAYRYGYQMKAHGLESTNMQKFSKNSLIKLAN